MTPSTAKRHLLKLQSDIEKSEAKLQEAGFSDANGSVRKFDLRTIEAINVLVLGLGQKPKRLTKKATKLLEEAGCNEISDDYVMLGSTDLRILLPDDAIEDLNAQAREQASYR
ncbi:MULTISPECIES: hypothetical protein [Comamonas]|uniref:hypothetical protein n=1 Tax=Comamonas TaxID=283 RepID=UPI0015F7F7AB|nr:MULTISPECIES: hypothetical protein [Comamonas]UUC96600.1 hypothetical protein NOX35_27200 [Comamonas sp. C11]